MNQVTHNWIGTGGFTVGGDRVCFVLEVATGTTLTRTGTSTGSA